MFRRDVLKGVVGGAAAVALGEIFSGKAEAAPMATCQNARYACASGCGTSCQSICASLTNCTACTNACTPKDPCVDQYHQCGSALGRCTRQCNQFCDDPARAECPICVNRNC